MTSSKSRVRNVPPPAGSEGKGSVYSRFIPREELGGFAAWQPGAFAGDSAAPAHGVHKPADEPPPEDNAQLLRAARAQGYQDGYRDGLAALEQFKQSFAAQTSGQIGVLLTSAQAQLDALHQEMAHSLAVAATQLAHQVVRSELGANPQSVAQVATEALETLLLSARHITVRVHPDDHPLVALGAAASLEARGARLLADAGVARGGCLVESDIGVVDAGIATRWRRAVARLGLETPWEGEPGAATT
jgi:flagellar assembly protein FliH